MSRECPNCGGMRIAGISHQCQPLGREQLRAIVREELHRAMTDLRNMLKPASSEVCGCAADGVPDGAHWPTCPSVKRATTSKCQVCSCEFLSRPGRSDALCGGDQCLEAPGVKQK